jgi:hypothetical protein
MCGVHFEPVPVQEERWKRLCEQHRRPLINEWLRMEMVAGWARDNWIKLEPIMVEEKQKEYYKRRANFHGLSQSEAEHYAS